MARDKWTNWKVRLTRAQKRGPMHVLDEWRDFEVFCGVHGWPDWWQDFQRAADDAFHTIKYSTKETANV